MFFSGRGEYVNKQNYCIWDSEKPQVIKERPLHLEKVTVLCILWSKRGIGLYFFENDDGTTVTVNSKYYGHMVTDLFLPAIEEYDTNHTTHVNITLLQETFPACVIFHRNDINWAPRSCNLTPLNFYLLGYAKDRVYILKSSNLEHLKSNIRQVMAVITPNMFQKVVRNYLKRSNACNTSRHLNNVVFHT